MDKPSLYQALVDAGVPISNHSSDLYFEKNDTSIEIAQNYPELTIATFHNQLTKTEWFEAYFQFVPYWIKIAEK